MVCQYQEYKDAYKKVKENQSPEMVKKEEPQSSGIPLFPSKNGVEPSEEFQRRTRFLKIVNMAI